MKSVLAVLLHAIGFVLIYVGYGFQAVGGRACALAARLVEKEHSL